MKHKKPQPIDRPIWQWLLVGAVLLCLIFGGVYAIHERRAQMSWTENLYAANPRLPGTFRFEPKPDITAYELALSIPAMMGSVDYLERMRPFYDAMPPEAKRHWLTPESAPPPPDHDHDHLH